MKNSKLMCNDFQQLMINKLNDELQDSEQVVLDAHLKSCESCREYQNVLAQIEIEMSPAKRTNLAPDPAIRQAIVRTIRQRKKSYISMVLNFVRSILNYRIPVYQGLIATAGVLLLIIVISNLHLITTSSNVKMKSDSLLSAVSMENMNIINLQILDQQKIGINATEDTVIMKFISTAL